MVHEAQADAVESSNIVGFQQLEIKPGWQLFTVTFKDVQNAEFDVQKVKVVNSDGTDYTINNKIKICKISDGGEYSTIYNYRLSKGGWCQGAALIDDGVVTFASGEGVALNNGDVASLFLQVSGEVVLTPVSTEVLPSSWKIIGNMTPVTVDIQDVIPYIGDTICSNNNKVKICKINAAGEYGTIYNYRQSKGGWCQGAALIGRDVFTLAPGESVAVNNGESSSITLKFPSPLSE